MEMSQRDVKRLQMLQRAVCDLAKPFIDGKLAILNCTLPRYRIHKDGTCETIYPSEVVEALAKWDELYQQAVEYSLIPNMAQLLTRSGFDPSR